MNKEEKFRRMFQLCNKWIYLDNINKKFTDHVLLNQTSFISIYGLGNLGIRLIERLGKEGIGIKYGVDKKKDVLFTPFEVFDPSDSLPSTQLMIITPIYEMEEISNSLIENNIERLVSLEEIINDLWIQEWTRK